MTRRLLSLSGKLAAVLFLVPACAPGAKLLPFYVGDEQYRFDETDYRCREKHLCAYEPPDNAEHKYSLNFIEFRDSGEMFDERQLAHARERVREARSGARQVVVFIYIHGWHNNAQDRKQTGEHDCADKLYDGDVAKFRNCGLKVFAENPPGFRSGQPPLVVGIYLAWHGTDFGWPPLYYVPSYPFRRHFARKVGLTGMARALRSIFAAIQEERDSYFVIAMGHSFGARVLEAADEAVDPKYPEAGIVGKIRLGMEPLVSKAAAPRLPVDIIFYVNAATSNFISRQTIHDWNSACGSKSPPAGCGKDPLYLAVSSRADVLTAIVMPIANVVFFAPKTDSYHIIAAANTPSLQTHKIPRRITNPPTGAPPEGFCFGVPASETKTIYYEVQMKAGKAPARFWAMDSDHWIASLEGMLHNIPILRDMVAGHWVISSHGDVWNTGVFNMVRAVIAREQARALNEDVPCAEPTPSQMLKAKG